MHAERTMDSAHADRFATSSGRSRMDISERVRPRICAMEWEGGGTSAGSYFEFNDQVEPNPGRNERGGGGATIAVGRRSRSRLRGFRARTTTSFGNHAWLRSSGC